MATGDGTAYREGREALAALLSALTPEEWDRRVPTCPEWTVRQTLAHLVGVCADANAGRLDGITTEAWTAAQVEARVDRSGPEILDEWAQEAPPLEAMADGSPGALAQWVFDLVAHEQDLREAIGVPGGDGTARADVAVGWVDRAFAGHLEAQDVGLAPDSWLDLRGIDRLRALTGRMPIDEVVAHTGAVDRDVVVRILTWGPFTPRRT